MKENFFAIMDVEYTSWKGSMQRNWSLQYEFPEIVEIGVIKFQNFKSNNFKKINLMFKIEKKILSLYFQHLTNIRQSYFNNVAKAPEEQFKKLAYFLNDVSKIFCIGTDKEIIIKNLKKNNLKYSFVENIYDIRPKLANIFNKTIEETISSDLIKFAGIEKKLNKHRSLDDAYSVYLCLKKLFKEKKINIDELKLKN